MKLTKQQSKAHKQALDLVHSDRALSWDERVFILENYVEAQGQLNTLAGAFFTPFGLARDLSIEVDGRSVIDLCAGIGVLSFACYRPGMRLVCVEKCADYVVVGRRVIPEAEWIEGDVFEASGSFDIAISNPPFGAIPGDWAGKYTGGQFEFKVIEKASTLAAYGVFILPQNSAPFRYSGRSHFSNEESPKAKAFREQTGIIMGMNCGIDTGVYVDEWRGVSPMCEIVCCDFSSEETEQQPVNPIREIAPVDASNDAAPPSGQIDLFDMDAA